MRATRRSLVCLALALPLVVGSPAFADWPQWRGPDRDGSVEGPAWPADLTSVETLWRVELGKSYAGAIVGGSRVFVVETANGDTEIVRALDRETGEQLWSASWPGDGKVPFFARSAGDWIRSTPAYDGESLYVGGMNEVLVSLDAATGEENWRVDGPTRFGTKIPDFGFVTSPLVDGDHLYVQMASSIVKLDKRTGDTIWRGLAHDASIMSSGAFSSPLVATFDGRRQLLVQTREELHGIDPETGESLWHVPVPHFRGMNILTPTVYDDGVFTSTYRNRSFFYRIGAGESGATEAWSHKSQAYMSSPVVVEGTVYLHMGNGRLTAIDLASGEDRWTSRPLGKYMSMIVQDDRILALADDGTLYLVRATPERFELIDSREVADQATWGHLAVSGDELYVRELEGLVVYRWGRGSGASAGHATP